MLRINKSATAKESDFLRLFNARRWTQKTIEDEKSIFIYDNSLSVKALQIRAPSKMAASIG